MNPPPLLTSGDPRDTAALLERLCTRHPKLIEEVDVICGTSTGGLLALMLADGYSPQQIKNIYWYKKINVSQKRKKKMVTRRSRSKTFIGIT
jgi:patatin-like phospholipase/acyl hydrolase